MATLPTLINTDTLPVFLVQIGVPLNMGDGQLDLLGGMPLRLCDRVSEAAITSAMTAMSFVSADITTIVTTLRNMQATKA